jgi:cytoskeletal protein RodZ
MGIIGGFTFAALFFAAAEYEHMTGWKWAVASLAVTATVKGLFPLSFIFVLPAQFGLFFVFWWMNAKHKAAREVERASAQDADRRTRQERARRAQEQAQGSPEQAERETAQAAREEAALRERQERVRRAREEREREEREQAQRNKPTSGQ